MRTASECVEVERRDTQRKNARIRGFERRKASIEGDFQRARQTGLITISYEQLCTEGMMLILMIYLAGQ